ncbi:DUF5446 family protein [Bacillus sp. CLL-7-23]|uniref:DUF5446 family protein n=1 Tax=Bacillus changyiensis TaxID=3004103 RepID=A0ABT4WZY6_9BACI|nr:DUF5446 family protein [Bacillus changyiensis]MDA7025601.1 DUF5446 family protein [Bacillus changyiensis]
MSASVSKASVLKLLIETETDLVLVETKLAKAVSKMKVEKEMAFRKQLDLIDKELVELLPYLLETD